MSVKVRQIFGPKVFAHLAEMLGDDWLWVRGFDFWKWSVLVIRRKS